MTAVLERQMVRVRPTSAALGADIEWVDLARDLAAETVDAVKRAWSDHLVLRFRGQRLDDDQLMRFSAHFGELDWAPIIAASRQGSGRRPLCRLRGGRATLYFGDFERNRERHCNRRARRLRGDLAHRH